LRVRAPIARLPVLVPYLDFPPGGHAGIERLAAIRDVDGVGRHRLAAVPQIPGVGAQCGLRGCHQHAVRRLAQAARVRIHRSQHPTQAGFGNVDSLRVDAILAAELKWTDGGRTEHGAGNKEEDSQAFHSRTGLLACLVSRGICSTTRDRPGGLSYRLRDSARRVSVDLSSYRRSLMPPMNRRYFIRAGAAGLGAAALGFAGQAGGSKPLRVGMIGSGWYGKCDLFRLIQVAPVEVVSLCDVDRRML